MAPRQGQQGRPGDQERAQAIGKSAARRQGSRQAGNTARRVRVRARSGGVSRVKQLHDLGAGRW